MMPQRNGTRFRDTGAWREPGAFVARARCDPCVCRATVFGSGRPGSMRLAPRIRRACGILLALAAPATASAQATVTITGVVRDSVTNAPIGDVRIALDGVRQTATTDGAGSFALARLEPGVYTLRATRVGFDDLVIEGLRVGDGGGLRLELTMNQRAIPIDAVVVSPGAFSFMGSVPAASQTLSRIEIESVPQFGEDIFRAVKHLPGLTAGDYAAHFSIRGGRPDQNLILLDGLEIYEPYHMKDYADGAFSIVDVETIGGVELMTGGFPALYGNRASGVFSMTSRVPEPGAPHYSVGVSLLNARAMAEGSFAGDRGSWMVSARRGYLDLILDLLKQIDLPSPRYYDTFAKATYRLGTAHEVSFEALHARDHYVFDAAGTTGFADSIDTRELANNRYGNTYAWATLRSLLGERVSVTSMLSAGVIESSRDGTEEYVDGPGVVYSITNRRDFHVFGVKQDWRFDASDALSLRAGIDARRLTADYAVTTIVGQNPDDPTDDTLSYYPHETRSRLKRDGSTFAAYGSARLAPVDPVTIEAGLRYDRGSYTGDSDLSPRVNALFRLPGDNRLRLGWGYFRQMQGIADVEALEGPGTYFSSELTRQWTLGLEHPLSDGGSLRVESYLRAATHTRPDFRSYRGGLDVFPETSEDWILVYPDSVSSRGVEAYWRQRIRDDLSITAGYALTRVTEWTRAIDNVNVPEPLAFRPRHDAPQDQRHAVSLDMAYRPSETWTVHASYAFHTGWPATTERLVPTTTTSGEADYTVRPNALYDDRFPAYQRLDVRVTKRVTKARGDLRFFFEVTNLTNHENVFGYDNAAVPSAQGGIRLEQDYETGFIIMPSLGISWRGGF